MAAAHERNGAKSTAVIAPLTYLEITDVREITLENADAGMQNGRVVDQSALVKLGNEPLDFRCAEEEVDLGQCLDELLLVALHHAPNADDGPAGARLLETSRLDQCVDRLFLGGVDEPTSVDDDDLRLVEVRRELRTTIRELSDVALAINGVLVAAESKEGELQRG